ncbi:MAG: hypothetical protein GYB24_06740 [Rhodobacteraceae bacterium]|nr:hypothetical protein [Paracoccaceae bacterium]
MKFPYSFPLKVPSRNTVKKRAGTPVEPQGPQDAKTRRSAPQRTGADWLGTGVLRDEFTTKSAAFAHRAAHRHRALACRAAVSG